MLLCYLLLNHNYLYLQVYNFYKIKSHKQKGTTKQFHNNISHVRTDSEYTGTIILIIVAGSYFVITLTGIIII